MDLFQLSACNFLLIGIKLHYVKSIIWGQQSGAPDTFMRSHTSPVSRSGTFLSSQRRPRPRYPCSVPSPTECPPFSVCGSACSGCFPSVGSHTTCLCRSGVSHEHRVLRVPPWGSPCLNRILVHAESYTIHGWTRWLYPLIRGHLVGVSTEAVNTRVHA